MGTVFKQAKERRAHADMLPANMDGFRESRDSEANPLSVPIQLYLDVTGSMGKIPVHLIKEGLPHLISTIIQRGVPDVALMFGAIGDHECDQVPLQLGQFESGDEELDMWLERVYPEKGGGSNYGESYGLAWFTAANFIKTDAKDKRGQKGFVFTIGDEPNLPVYPGSALKSIFGSNLPQANARYTAKELYDAACVDNHVFHIHIDHNRRGTDLEELMGQNCITTNDHTKIPEIIAETVLSFHNNTAQQNHNASTEEHNEGDTLPGVIETDGNEPEITL